MKKLVFLFALLGLVACQKKSEFHVVGTMPAEDANKVLYLEHVGLMQTETVDSVLLGTDASFSLKAGAPQYPDLYRLRCGREMIILAVDSTETITIAEMHASNEKSEQIALLRTSLKENDFDTHKQAAKTLILSDPASMAAYYALFQSKEGQPVFDWNNPKDLPFFQAVATAMNIRMPEYERTKVLYNQVHDVITSNREQKAAEAMRKFVAESENGFLDIALPERDGVESRLSEYKGKVIILDFSSFQMPDAQDYVFALRDLYNQYASRGLAIYSVSVDNNQLAWEDWTRNLPWTCVRLTEGATCIRDYNVTEVPTLFLFDRKGMIQGRYMNFEELKKAITKYL